MKERSPNYPRISLPDAVDMAKKIYEKEKTAQTSREVLAKAMGYAGLNGASIAVLSGIRKYGLIEGRGEDYRLSGLAVDILLAPRDSAARNDAIETALLSAEIFAELLSSYGWELPSNDALQYALVKRGFSRDGAITFSAALRDSLAFFQEQTGRKRPSVGSPATNEAERSLASVPSRTSETADPEIVSADARAIPDRTITPRTNGHVERTILFDEIEVELVFSEKPSAAHWEDLLNYVEFRLRSQRRRATPEQD